MSPHAKERWKERATEREEDELLESVYGAGLIAETTRHKYLRNDDYVHVMAKIGVDKEVVKTVMPWDEFRKKIQVKIEKYNFEN